MDRSLDMFAYSGIFRKMASTNPSLKWCGIAYFSKKSTNNCNDIATSCLATVEHISSASVASSIWNVVQQKTRKFVAQNLWWSPVGPSKWRKNIKTDFPGCCATGFRKSRFGRCQKRWYCRWKWPPNTWKREARDVRRLNFVKHDVT